MTDAIRFLADEDFRGAILRGLRGKCPNIDLVRAVDIGLDSTPDSVVLEHAAAEARIVLSQDVSTMKAAAETRLRAGLRMPGVVVAPQWLATGPAINDLELIAMCSLPGEWENRKVFLPLKRSGRQ